MTAPKHRALPEDRAEALRALSAADVATREQLLAQVRDTYEDGYSCRAIADVLHVTETTVWRWATKGHA